METEATMNAIRGAIKTIEELPKENLGGPLCAGYITVGYKGRLTKAMKELGVRKDYNAYGFKGNIIYAFSVNSRLDEMEKMVEEIIKRYKLSNVLRVTSRAI